MTTARSILTRQKAGFLTAGPYPFTHSLSAYTGCGFGVTTCGMFCYAQYLPNWRATNPEAPWGSIVFVKENTSTLLDTTLQAMGSEQRRALRIFMSSSTDPYQPLEAKWHRTQQCLEVFARYPDLDLLVVQTRSPLVERDFELLRNIPYVWLSMTIETDDQDVFRRLRGGPPPARRMEVVRRAARAGIKVQVAVSPCLPYTDAFGDTLNSTEIQRVIVDTFVTGDGTGGRRTGQTPYAQTIVDWDDPTPARKLFEQLKATGVDVGWSSSGFCGIPPRVQPSHPSSM